MGDQNIGSVRNWRFLGFANYHRSFIPHFLRIAVLLYAVTGKICFRWDKEHQRAFDSY